jgi:hypothetical protein
VIDSIKLANIGIDGEKGFQGEWEIIDPNHCVLRMKKCIVMEKWMEEGLYPPDRAWMNCKAEKEISETFFLGCELDIKLPPPDLKIPPREPFCVWTYTKKTEK